MLPTSNVWQTLLRNIERFRYQKLADILVCFPPSVGEQVRWLPSWKICLRIQLSLICFVFFPKVGINIENNILQVLVEGFVSPILQIDSRSKLSHKLWLAKFSPDISTTLIGIYCHYRPRQPPRAGTLYCVLSWHQPGTSRSCISTQHWL